MTNLEMPVVVLASEPAADIPATTELKVVDFDHPELCSRCGPVTCIVEGADFSGGNWRDVLLSLTEVFLQSKPKSTELYYLSLFHSGFY